MDFKFKPPEIDVEKHIEVRKRRVFPIRWEQIALEEGYSKAWEKFNDIIAQKEKLFTSFADAHALSSRQEIFDVFLQNINKIREFIDAGDTEGLKSFLAELQRKLLEIKEQENKMLSSKVNELKQFGVEYPVRKSSSSDIVYYYLAQTQSKSQSQPVQTQTSKPEQTQQELLPQTPLGFNYSKPQEVMERKLLYEFPTGKVYAVVVNGKVRGYEAINNFYGGVSTLTLSDAIKWAQKHPYMQSISAPNINPFKL